MDPPREDVMAAIETRRFDDPDQNLGMKARGDVFEIPQGDDGHVDGAERVELILPAPPEHPNRRRTPWTR
jgi:hypothetical protein